MKSSEGVNPTAPWNQQPMQSAQLPSYAEAVTAGAPYPTQMPQPYSSQQPTPPYPVQQPFYPTAPEFPIYSQPNPTPVYQQYQSSEYTTPVVNHPATHVQHIVTHLPTEQPSGCRGRKGSGVLLGLVLAIVVIAVIIRATSRGF